MLTKREKEILKYASFGNKEIAKILCISWKTVQRCFANMYERTETKTRTELLLKAIKEGELKQVDMGFWDENDEYQQDIQTIDMRKI